MTRAAAPAPATAPMRQAVDLENFLDDAPISRTQILALVMCAFALLIDGFDLFLVGNLAPAVASSFGVATARLSLVFLFQQVGLAVGAFVISPISDRAGRKRVLLACAALFGLLTLGALLAHSLLAFAVARGLAGIFLSGLIPNAIALLVEVTPKHRRGLFVSIAFTGYGAGSVGGALVGALLLKNYGWQSGFWIAGIAALLYFAVAVWMVPESLAFLHRRDPSDPIIDATIRRMNPAIGGVTPIVEVARRQSKASMTWRDIFRGGWAPSTLILWAIFFLTSGTLALVFAWMPAFFTTRGGISIQTYSSVASFSLVGALLGTLSIGYVLDRFSSTRVLIITFLITISAMQLLGHATFGTKLFIFALMALSLFQGAGQTALSAVVVQFYPTGMRATGVGWAFGAGRIGGIAGPVAGGLMLAAGLTIPQFFAALAVPIGLTILLLLALQRASAIRQARLPHAPNEPALTPLANRQAR